MDVYFRSCAEECAESTQLAKGMIYRTFNSDCATAKCKVKPGLGVGLSFQILHDNLDNLLAGHKLKIFKQTLSVSRGKPYISVHIPIG